MLAGLVTLLLWIVGLIVGIAFDFLILMGPILIVASWFGSLRHAWKNERRFVLLHIIPFGHVVYMYLRLPETREPLALFCGGMVMYLVTCVVWYFFGP